MAASDSCLVDFELWRCNAQKVAVGHRFSLLSFNQWVELAGEGGVKNNVLQHAKEEWFQVCGLLTSGEAL